MFRLGHLQAQRITAIHNQRLPSDPIGFRGTQKRDHFRLSRWAWRRAGWRSRGNLAGEGIEIPQQPCTGCIDETAADYVHINIGRRKLDG